MSPELATIVASIAIAILGGAFAGFAGFGTGLLMAPLLTLIHPPEVVVPTLVGMSVLGNGMLLRTVRSEVKIKRLAWVLVPAFVGLPIGIYALTSLDPAAAKRVLNVAVLVLVGVLAAGFRFENADRPGVLVPAGLISGTLSGIGSIGGPPIVLTFLSLNDPPATTRANLIAFLAMSGVVAIGMMGVAGVLSIEVLELGATCIIPYFGTLALGARLFRRSDPESYRRVALGFLACVALLSLLWPI